VIERAVILGEGEAIAPAHFPQEITRGGRGAGALPEADLFTGQPEPLEEIEKRYIGRVLAFCGGNRSQAAQLLEIARSTLINKIKKYGLNGSNGSNGAGSEGMDDEEEGVASHDGAAL
jgi:DNA-binding NtrC family response regulator